ncbi:hypothetical protein C6Y14_16065 [Streptomyces dioscori]|uniref:Uncharacterized protein n=1 Tax=Streptomyces dioscori TaxID=2109333 RepID=A0A2P8Q8W7_9ACTN|nr:DUF6281 family protein [Streptomyces dioscori]PSM42695.1 hypothetical protein C6Y14_16065 [Streptomyces dioscori]
MFAACSLFLAVACTATSSGEDGGGSAASCAFAVQFRGELYTRVKHADFTVSDALGSSRRTLCDDTGSDPSSGTIGTVGTVGTETYTTYRIEELDAGTAVAVRDTPANAGRRDGLNLYVLQLDGGPPDDAKRFLDENR